MAAPVKKKFHIKPFKPPKSLDDDTAQQRWALLRSAIHKIHEQKAASLSFEELYRNAYNLVLHNHGELLYDGVHETVRAHLMEIAAAVVEQPDELLLKELNTKWTQHEVTMNMIRDILMYMDRTYVAKNKKYPVYHFGLMLFRDVIVRHPNVKRRLQGTLLANVERERQGEMVDKVLMKNTLSMLVELGIDSTRVYESEFEYEFLEATRRFYRQESQEFLAHNTCPDYLEKAEARLAQERRRVEDYLFQSTGPKLKAIVERHLIADHAQTLVEMETSGCVAMLRDDKLGDLGRMYRLFAQVPGCLDIVRGCLKAYVTDLGKKLVTDSEEAKSPVEFVQRLLDMRDKFSRIVGTAFDGNKAFERSLREAFEAFMNMDTRCAQFLSLYIDDNLRHGMRGMSEEDVDTRLNKVVLLFRLLQDKDVFENFYKTHLQKRLLNGKSQSDEWERAMISKLKSECGYQFTSKLEGMFQDMRMSKTIMEEYKREEGRPNAVELDVTVLTTGFWPAQQLAAVTLPADLAACCKHFEAFYLRSRTGRRLSWLTNRGTADLRAVFGAKRHELTVSTFQMVILLLFNGGGGAGGSSAAAGGAGGSGLVDTLTFAEILAATQIPEAELRRHLISLTTPRHRILIKERKGKEIEAADRFTFNDGFTSKLIRVKVPLVSSRTTATAVVTTAVPAPVEDDRKHLIEAAIVRIMKARKQMEHNMLVAEVTKQLSTRFAPSPANIKKRIESLIEREYLERTTRDRRLYNYLA